jgi:hypothetical protein
MVVLGGLVVSLASAGGASALPAFAAGARPHTLPSVLLVPSPPRFASAPDDLAMLPLFDHGSTDLWTEYGNGVNPNGSASSPGGATQSTLAGYDPSTGKLVRTLNLTGHVDGFTADPSHDALLVTANEDANAVLYVVFPASSKVVKFNFTPGLETSGNGGADSLALWHGGIYLSHSNPNDTAEAATFLVTLDWYAHAARVSPVYWDDSHARFLPANTTGHLALTDPDTNYVMPAASPRFAGALATISQGDGRIVFAKANGHHVGLTQLNLTDNVSGNLPPIDGLVVATASSGTLYVVDAKGNTISALVTDGWPKGTVFVTEPKDNGNPLLGVLDLTTGHITPLGNAFLSPKGLFFVPGHHYDAPFHGAVLPPTPGRSIAWAWARAE